MGRQIDQAIAEALGQDDGFDFDDQDHLAQIERDARRPLANGSHHATAFIVEAMVLLVFLVLALAMTTSMTASARSDAALASDLSAAVALAQNTAEEFAADPEGFAASPAIIREGEDGLRAECTVEAQERVAGTMYAAHITVTGGDSALAQRARARIAADEGNEGNASGDEVYSLETSAYVSAGGASDE